ncbi:AraC family transcriptional regulator [Streptomyces sp. NBC_00199]|uniref:helix-turn-helix domain-containing protein n=1 Tax=Streptomyces sp. NBC_00199 TaxID=2975678 RepID=UPI002257BAE6|nr:helix-turn-helix domain-containing protein [Streptomyces sp. NBC_00199]MCX5268279.1 helix-turn-helix domain-containing protein [Streptomyces sp. NBC_00199]
MTNALAEPPLPVPFALRAWIAGIGDVAVDRAPEDAYTHVPDTATKVVVRVAQNGRHDTLVVGPRTRATYHADPDERLVSCTQLRLAPGAVGPLLGVPAGDLVGRAVPAADLPGPAARRLARELAAGEPQEITARLADLLPPPVDGSRERLLRAAVDALSTRADRAPAAVHDVARELAVSERQLRNLFAVGVGVSPKHYARIDRVRHLLTHAASTPWAQLAADAGFYDQSHMTADFRTLMGVPPTAFFSGRLPRATPCGAPRPR